jgi:PAS domain S-box-containing protein
MQKAPKQIELSNIKSILSRTDLKGNIKYCNKYFSEISGYTEAELLNTSHNIIRHPDMPKVVFKWMWQRLKNNKNMIALVKNKTKNGDYYWVTTSFETKLHPFDKTPEGYLALRKAAPEHAIKKIEPLYKELLAIEEKEGVEASEKHLLKFLRNQGKDYDGYIQELLFHKGIINGFFDSMRRLLIA